MKNLSFKLLNYIEEQINVIPNSCQVSASKEIEKALNLKLKELELRMKQKEFEETYAEFNDDEEEVKEKLSAKDKKKRLDMIRKAVEKINAKNAERAKKDALKMMKDLDF